jgi:hypothetical protein
MKLRIKVSDEGQKPLPCKITVGGETVYCPGYHAFDLKTGTYDLTVTRGKLYEPHRERVMLKKNTAREITLRPIVNHRDFGLFSFDAHSHTSRDPNLTGGDLRRASAVMKGEGFDFFFAGSPYDNATHREDLTGAPVSGIPYRERFASDIQAESGGDFKLDIGNELIKCRYGHVFMMNYDQYPPFSRYYDKNFDPWQFGRKTDMDGAAYGNMDGEKPFSYGRKRTEPPYEIEYIHQALKREKAENSVAVAAHPTSWWLHENGEFITNIFAALGFELLAGSIDAMVIMGYDKDHQSYQKLWNEVLRSGYFLPGISETDAAFDTLPKEFLEFKTYTKAGALDIDALCRGIKSGKNIVSSGPLLLLTVNGNEPGAKLNFNPREPVAVKVDCFACSEAPLSRIQIILNGSVFKEFDANQSGHEITFRVPNEGFIYAKCYDFAGNVAITNPVYIRNTPFANQNYRAKGAVYINGKEAPFDAKLTDDIPVKTPEGEKTVNLFEMPELQAIFKNLYLGGFTVGKKYLPGEVPAEAFQIKRIKEILDSAEIRLTFPSSKAKRPNPRIR